MIQRVPNFLTKRECQWYIDWYEGNRNRIFTETNEYVENYEGIEVDVRNEDFPLFKKISPQIMEFLRIQKTDVNVNPIQKPHTHETPNNFVIFLNEGFEGGELIFESGEVFKPEVGTMIMFEREGHYPKRVTRGERWVMVSFLNSGFKWNKELL